MDPNNLELSFLRQRIKELEEKENQNKMAAELYQATLNAAAEYIAQINQEREKLKEQVSVLEKTQAQSSLDEMIKILETIHQRLEDALLLDENLAEGWMDIKNVSDLALKTVESYKQATKPE